MMALVLVAMYFAMTYLGTRSKLAVLRHHALRAAKRLSGIPDFWYYAVADGIREILARSVARPFQEPSPQPTRTAQLDLFDLVDT